MSHPTSSYLTLPLRSISAVHHMTRIRELRRSLAAYGYCIQDLTAAMKDFTSDAHYDDRLARHYIARDMFKALRNNLTIAKGDWDKALDWMRDDALAARESQEDYCWEDSVAERRSQDHARGRVI